MYVWHVCNKLQKWSQANKWCLRVIALHSRTWTFREQLIVSLHWCRARAVKWATNIGIFRVTSRSIKNSAFRKWQAKLAQRKSHHLGATSTVGQTSISREKPLQIQGVSEETSRLPSCQPALSVLLFRKDGYPHRLKKAHSTLARNVTETTSTITRENPGIFRVTSTVKGESAWKRVGQHCARTGQGKTSTCLQQEINRRSRSISHWLCIVNAPRPRELASPHMFAV